MTHIATPRPWPEGIRPTPLQLLAYLRDPEHSDVDDDALRILAALLDANETADRCIVADHDSEIDRCWKARTDAVLDAHRYRLAWLSARRWRRAYRHVMAHHDRSEDRP